MQGVLQDGLIFPTSCSLVLSFQPMQVLEAVCEATGTELHALLLEWCYKVLAYMLLHNEGDELGRVLSFYEQHMGVGLRPLLEAVAPALLEEVVWLMGESAADGGTKR